MEEIREGEATDNRSGARGVFVSYASADATVATLVAESLERAGIACWMAPRDVTPGTFYADEIVRAIDASKILVLILSAGAVGSLHVLREVERAASKRHPVIPLRIEPVALPPALEYFLNSSQWLDATRGNPSGAMPALVAAVQFALQKTQNPQTMSASAPRAPVAGAGLSSSRRLSGRAAAGVVLAGIAALAAYWAWRTEHRAANSVAPSVAGIVPTALPGTTAFSRKSIAVLPFQNLSGRPEDAYLADGLQEEILNALARARDLKVISRTSVQEFRDKVPNVREISQRLGVGSILEGSVRREGNTLRLTVQLIDALDDRHLLATNFDRDLNHVLNLQSTVARQVAEALEATLTRNEQGELERVATNNGDAYNLYLRALAAFQKETPSDPAGVVEPKRLLLEALHADPDYADAYALLSQTDTQIYYDSRRPEDGAQAKQDFERALAIDPELPEALLARGMYSLYVAEDLDTAITELQSVIRLRPNSAAAHMLLGSALRRRGRMEEALEHLTRATDLDPLNHAYSLAPLTTYLGLRRYPEAIEQTNIHAQRFHDQVFTVRARIESQVERSAEPLRRVLREQSPQLEGPVRSSLEVEVACLEGRYRDAIRLLEAMPSTDPVARADQLAFLNQAAGDPPRAMQLFRTVESGVHAMQQRGPVGSDALSMLALAQSMLGEHPAALETIELAVRQDPETRDAVNGPNYAFIRSIIWVRAGRDKAGYDEAARLVHVPFGAPNDFLDFTPDVRLVIKDDPHFDELINRSPRL